MAKSYIICTSPRSGSTMLCKLLTATQIAGHPSSLFHKPSIDAWLEAYGLGGAAYASKQSALCDIFDAAKERGRGETGVFGLRLQRGSVAFFLDQLAVLYPNRPSDAARIKAAFGPTLFIYLSRRDKLDQAISYMRAEQTGLWHRKADGTDLERNDPERRDGYDPEATSLQIAEFAGFEDAWRAWFVEQSVTPLEVSYDQLAGDPQGQLARVLTALGQDGSIARRIPVQTSKLADDISRDWRARYSEAGVTSLR